MLAFLVAPLAVPIVATISFACGKPGGSIPEMVGLLLMSAIFSLPLAYGTELVLGLPAHLLLRRLGIHSRIVYGCVGVVVGFIAIEAFGLWMMGHDGRSWVDWCEGLLNPAVSMLNVPTVSAVIGGGIAAAIFAAIVRPTDRQR